MRRTGERNGNARLTEVQIAEIRGAHRELTSFLCREYGLTRSHLQKIIRGQRWSHLNEETLMETAEREEAKARITKLKEELRTAANGGDAQMMARLLREVAAETRKLQTEAAP